MDVQCISNTTRVCPKAMEKHFFLLFFHLVSPARHFRYPPPPILGVLSSIISLFLISQTLEHPKMCFTGSRPTQFLIIQPSPPKRCRKWVFSSREPGRALQVPVPPNLRVLNSIISLLLINQTVGPPKMRFSGSKPTEFSFRQPSPPKRCRKWGFHLVSPARQLGYPPPSLPLRLPTPLTSGLVTDPPPPA